jgi:hypothetical protein
LATEVPREQRKPANLADDGDALHQPCGADVQRHHREQGGGCDAKEQRRDRELAHAVFATEGV